MVTLRIRKGLNGYPYSICNDNGIFIANYNSLEEIHEYYKVETKSKSVLLKKETTLYPSDTKVSEINTSV